MPTIYLILGIIGWTAAAIVVPAYVWKGRQAARHAAKEGGDGSL